MRGDVRRRASLELEGDQRAMGAKKSQRNAALVVFGIIAAFYLLNLVIFSPDGEGQLVAGGLMLVASGAVWIYLLGAPDTLHCDRTLNTCRLIKARFLLTPKSVRAFPLERLRDVSVNETYLPSHDSPAHKGYEVSLKIDDGRTHVFSTEEGERKADAIARRIKSFLKDDGQRSLTVRRFPWTMIALGIGSIIFGALLVLSGATGWPFAGRR